ncbi:hypothetical protein [Roseovarius albus]|nr:hypothetical protein [Roseovarius albus]
MEAIEGIPTASGTNLAKVQQALEAQGIQFLDNGDVAGGPGVALRSGE